MARKKRLFGTQGDMDLNASAIDETEEPPEVD